MDHISVSQMNLYQLCSLKYKFRYLDKIPPTFTSVNLAFGSAIHSALAWLHEELKAGNKPSLEEFQQIFSIDWQAQTEEENINYNGCGREELNLKGKEMLALYHAKQTPDIWLAEESFLIPIINLQTGEELDVPLEGIMDLIETDRTIVEFKTASKAFDALLLPRMLQLTAYSYAFEQLYKQRPSNLRLVAFIKNKKPKMEQLETSRNQTDYLQFFYTAKAILNGIKNQVFFPSFTYLCKDCEYVKECKKWEGG